MSQLLTGRMLVCLVLPTYMLHTIGVVIGQAYSFSWLLLFASGHPAVQYNANNMAMISYRCVSAAESSFYVVITMAEFFNVTNLPGYEPQ